MSQYKEEKRDGTSIRTIEGAVGERGEVRLLEKVALLKKRRAMVTILDEDPRHQAGEAALLSERALAEDWDRPGEDDAWSYLQSEQC